MNLVKDDRRPAAVSVGPRGGPAELNAGPDTGVSSRELGADSEAGPQGPEPACVQRRRERGPEPTEGPAAAAGTFQMVVQWRVVRKQAGG